MIIFIIKIIFVCLRHYGNSSENSYVYGNRDRVKLNCTLYSCSLKIYNVQPSDAGIYSGMMGRLLPYEENFHKSDRQHEHLPDVEANYGKFWLHVRIPVRKEIRIEPKDANEQVIIIMRRFYCYYWFILYEFE
jgi:hypothetical protein